MLDTATTSMLTARCPGWSFQSRSHSQLCRNAKRCRQPLSFTVRAEKGGLQQLFKKDDDEVSFKWDAANLRWTKSKGKMADDADMMVRPKIGAPYMVSYTCIRAITCCA